MTGYPGAREDSAHQHRSYCYHAVGSGARAHQTSHPRHDKSVDNYVKQEGEVHVEDGNEHVPGVEKSSDQVPLAVAPQLVVL